MNRRGKHVALLAGAVGALVLVGVAFAAKVSVLEQWWIWKLDSAVDADVSTAARKLGEMRSAKSVPHLVRHLAKWTEGKGRLIPQYHEGELNGETILLKDYAEEAGMWKFNKDVQAALIQIGDAAVRGLLDVLEGDQVGVFGGDEGKYFCRLAAVATLPEMGSAARTAIPRLEQMAQLRSLEEGFREVVDDALAKIHKN